MFLQKIEKYIRKKQNRDGKIRGLEGYLVLHYTARSAEVSGDAADTTATTLLFHADETGTATTLIPGSNEAGTATTLLSGSDDAEYTTTLIANEEKEGAAYPNMAAGNAVAAAAPMADSADFEPSALNERLRHRSDSFSAYLLYLIRQRGMTNAEVYRRALVDKKVFSKLKNSPDYHPQKLTALCLCVGAKLNLDETKDLLARAGYALSPCDKTDIIFSYFIENQIWDMIEIDIQLEEHGLPCLIA